MKHPAQMHERDRIQRAATQRMTSPRYTYRARQHPAEMLQSVACLVGAGKTVALRAALATLDASRHTLIYLGNPSVGVRGINHAIVTALGGVPRTHHATLTPQAMDLLAREHAERGRIPVLAIDEAHMLEPGQLEAIRMLTNHDLDSACPLACLLIGQPTLRRRIKLGILAALDQRIAVRYTMPGMTSRGDHQLHQPPPHPRRPIRPAVQRRRHHLDPRHQPRPAQSRQQPRHPGPHRRLRHPQGHRRRNQRPGRRRRSHGRLTTKPPARTPRARRNTPSGAFPYAYVITANDAAVITPNVRAQPDAGDHVTADRHGSRARTRCGRDRA